MTDASQTFPQGIRIYPLRAEHDLTRFACGDDDLDKFIRKRATKHHSSHRIRVFCAQHGLSGHVLGLYALSIIPHDSRALKQNEAALAKSPFFSAVYIQTLGVLRHYQGNGIGTILLLNALRRSYIISQNAGLFAVALRSLNDRTTKLYERYGFDRRTDERYPLMILPILSLIDLFENRKPEV